MLKEMLKALFSRIVDFRKYQKIKKLLNQPRYKSGKSTLFEVPFYYVDASTFYAGYQEIFINHAYKFNSLIREPFIIDCGANIGISTIYFKKQFPFSKVIAFEADPAIFKTLERNIELNNIADVELINQAVWIDNGVTDFEVEGGFSGRINKYDAKNNIIEVQTIKLNDLLTKPIDFLKIDIEGAEFEVLKDCRKNLSLVKNLFIEYHSHTSETQRLGELLTILTESGFRYHIKEAYTMKQPFLQHDEMLGMDLQLNIYAINNLNG